MKDFHPDVAARLLAKMQTLHAEVNGPYSRSTNFLNPKMIDEPKIVGEPKPHPK